MKSLRHYITIVCILAAPLAEADERPVRSGANQDSFQDGKKLQPAAVRTLLEKGRASGSLPAGMLVRVSSCLGSPDNGVAGDRLPAETKKTWEFTSDQVRCVRFEETAAKATGQAGESRPFDSKSLCQDLLEGRAIEIQAAKGEGPEVGFIGSHYHAGGRSIEVVWKGDTILRLAETNGPILKLYHQSDARAFGALYERLVSRAHTLFASKPAAAR